MFSRRAALFGLLSGLAACLTACVEEGALAQDVNLEGHEHNSAALHVASSDGQQLTLSVYSGAPFALEVSAPLDALASSLEVEVSKNQGWQMEFSGLLPAKEDVLQPGFSADTEHGTAWCEDGNVEGISDGVSCQIPYVGYGTDDLTQFQISPDSTNARAFVYFHEVDSYPGAQVVMDYLLVLAHPTVQGGCVLFMDYSSTPLLFFVGAQHTAITSEAGGSTAGGVLFPVDSMQLDLPGEEQTTPCTLDLFPQPFVDFCPGNLGAQGLQQGSYWAQKCGMQFPGMGGYPTP